MHLYQLISPVLSFVLLILAADITLSKPVQSAPSNPLNSGDGVSIIAAEPFNDSIKIPMTQGANTSTSSTGSDMASTQPLTMVGTWPVNWHIIGTTISLNMTVGAWVLEPAKIVQSLVVAQEQMGKKVATALLDRKFKSETGSWKNRMIFEITPGWTDPKRLTWGDVTEVLGKNGLPRFFEEDQEWHSVYFEVWDGARGGVIGNGAVRKWYMIEPIGALNGTTVETG